MTDRKNLPRNTLPVDNFRLSELPNAIPRYSGDFQDVGSDDLPREVHMAFAIAITNVDQYMAFADAKRDTLDALTQAWRAVTNNDVEVEYSRAATSVEIIE
jgi:hypothetical protein